MKNKINFLDLGTQPLANNYLTISQAKKRENKYKLIVCFDIISKIVSIRNTFSSKEMFNNNYPYRSSMSKTMINSFRELSKKIKSEFRPKKILEIGSNDGAFIKNFKKNMTIGIEPCSNIEKITKRLNFNTYAKYWSIETAKKILLKHGKVDLIYSANTISHIEDLDEVFKAINIILNENGVFIIEDPSLLECLKNNTYDQFYNEHIYVFSTISLNNVLKKHNLQIFKVERLKIHGGSNRYYIKKNTNLIKIENSLKLELKKEVKFGINKLSTYIKFAKRVKKSRKELIRILKKLKKRNNKIIGYGATAKSTTILNYCKINRQTIDYFLDTTKEKQNKLMPGSKIPIIKYKGIIDKEVKYIFLGAWNFKKEIFIKEKKYIKNGGKFIIHTPKPTII